MKKIANMGKNYILVFLITCILLYFLLKDNFSETMRYLASVNIPLFAVALIDFFISMVFDSYSYYLIVHNYEKSYTPTKGFRLNTFTKFFNGITPLASGGQPFQVYLLHKEKVKMSDAVSIITQIYILFVLSVVLYAIMGFIYSGITHLVTLDGIILPMVLFGIIIYICILSITLLLIFSSTFMKKISSWVITILSEIRIIKDKDKAIEKWNQNCDNYYQSGKKFRNSPKLFFKCLGLQFLKLFAIYSVPYFVTLALHHTIDLNIFETTVASSYAFLGGCYIPIPGSSGGTEFAFGQIFGQFVDKGIVSPLIIIWRFITYILPIVLGGIWFNIYYKKQHESKKEKKE